MLGQGVALLGSIVPTLKPPDRQTTRQYHTGSTTWRRIRREILLRDAYTCQLCDHISSGNEVDHKDGDSWNNDPSNLRTLCKPCHSTHGLEGNSNPTPKRPSVK